MQIREEESMKNCVFCNFSDKDVVVYEDELCYAIISLNPINKYHVLIIPRAHYENFVDLPDKLASHIFLIAKKLSLAVRKACGPIAIHHISDDDISKEGYNLVAHYKFHIIPRFKNDGVKMEWKRENLDIETRSRLAKEVKKTIRRHPISMQSLICQDVLLRLKVLNLTPAAAKAMTGRLV